MCFIKRCIATLVQHFATLVQHFCNACATLLQHRDRERKRIRKRKRKELELDIDIETEKEFMGCDFSQLILFFNLTQNLDKTNVLFYYGLQVSRNPLTAEFFCKSKHEGNDKYET